MGQLYTHNMLSGSGVCVCFVGIGWDSVKEGQKGGPSLGIGVCINGPHHSPNGCTPGINT